MNLKFKKILCVRPDNMGDIVMSGPAMRALKQSFQCTLTLLTSPMGALITPYVPGIDATIICDIPWVKANDSAISNERGMALVQRIQEEQFDAAVIFTVYSQSALPAALILFMAGVPIRLAYSRENPYGLLTHWLPDKEPYQFIRHQVERDLELVSLLGASVTDNRLSMQFSKVASDKALQKTEQKTGIAPGAPYVVIHPGVSEDKRKYPVSLWSEVARRLYDQLQTAVIITGSGGDREEAALIKAEAGSGCFSLAGELSMEEWIAVINKAMLVVSVNTGTIHIAAATQTPAVVLYALTNPQHTPWQSPAIVLPYTVPGHLKSRNEVIHYVDKLYSASVIPLPEPEEVVAAATALLQQPDRYISRSILQPNWNPDVAHSRVSR